MKFIGRKSELSKLNAEYNRDSSFVVIYGRRRVGKTTLIKEFLKKKNRLLFSCHRGIGKPKHEAAGRCCGPYNEKYIAAKSSIHRLAGFVPGDCRL